MERWDKILCNVAIKYYAMLQYKILCNLAAECHHARCAIWHTKIGLRKNHQICRSIISEDVKKNSCYFVQHLRHLGDLLMRPDDPTLIPTLIPTSPYNQTKVDLNTTQICNHYLTGLKNSYHFHNSFSLNFHHVEPFLFLCMPQACT